MRSFVKFTEFDTDQPIWIDPKQVVAISAEFDGKKYYGCVILATGLNLTTTEKPETIAHKLGIELPLEAL